jgi:putative two-component system response regulator
VALAADIAGYHHERWDGDGYPEGLAGTDIPLPARLVAMADVYDAIRSERPYKPAYGRDEAGAYILENSGRHFDPAIVEAFRDREPDIARLYP